MSIKPLSGVRMLCVEQLMALPFGTQLLADMGADVLCIESLDYAGDEAIRRLRLAGRPGGQESRDVSALRHWQTHPTPPWRRFP